MMIRLLLCSLSVCLVGLASGCDASGPVLDLNPEPVEDTTYTPEPISGTLGFLTTEGAGQERTWIWKHVDIETGVVRTRSRLDALVKNGGQYGGGAYPIEVAESLDRSRLAIVTDSCVGCTVFAPALYVSSIAADSPVYNGTPREAPRWSPNGRRLLFDNGWVSDVTNNDSLSSDITCVACAFQGVQNYSRTLDAVWPQASDRVIVAPPSPQSTTDSLFFDVYEVDLRSPESPRRLNDASLLGSPTLSPDGKHAALRSRTSRDSPVPSYSMVNFETGDSTPLALPVEEGNDARVRTMLWNRSGRYLFVRYSQTTAGDYSDVRSTHIGLFDIEDPELRWQPLNEVLPFVIPDHNPITMFDVRQPDA